MDVPQIEQIQLGLKQLIVLGGYDQEQQFQKGNDTKSLAANIGLV